MPDGSAPGIDPAFLALPMRRLADAALGRARELGAEHADFRLERIRTQDLALRDGKLDSARDGEDLGFAVRVVHDGTWGFAAGVDLTPEAAVRVAEQAVEVARVSRPVNSEPIELADEPVHADVTWVSAYEVDPFGVPDARQDRRCWSTGPSGCSPPTASTTSTRPSSRCWRTSSTPTSPARSRPSSGSGCIPEVTATSVDRSRGTFESMRTCAPPVGRGWEYLTGDTWDWAGELARIPEWLAEKAKAPSVDPGRYDLVIDPSNLWLTIHESIGHATELDRALGYEAAYAGTSFATFDKLGTLRYGSDGHERDRRPHGAARPGHDRLRRRRRADPVLGHRPGRRAGRLPAGPADGPAQGPRPVQRVRLRRLARATSRCSGWPTCRSSRPRAARRWTT